MDKDPLTYSFLTYAWVGFLSMWGGAISWMQKRKMGETRPYNITELIGELVTSAFVGVITFWLCEYSEMNKLLSAALIGISGHMGSRAIFMFERHLMRRFKGD